MAIAIDFGTSNTVVARWNAVTQKPETVTLPGLSWRLGHNPPLIPSLLYVASAMPPQVIVGQAVRDRGLDLHQNPRFFQGFKRGIGATVQGFLPELDDQRITFEQVGQWFLTEVVEATRRVPLPVDSLVLTVPVDSFESYRHWLGRVCQGLAVERVRLLDEPTAAALGYGLADRDVLLVIDFGGGTLDLSLVRLNTNASGGQKPLGFILKWGEKQFTEQSGQQAKVARVLAKAGQLLGGSDIDRWLLETFQKNQGLPDSPLVQRLCERLKIQLSTQQQASEVYFDEETLDTYELFLDRDRLEAILREHGFFEALDGAMTQVLQQGRRQGVEVGDIDGVLLVGGTVQIPAVQAWVRQYFDGAKIRCEKPFEAIAQGALHLDQGIELKDFLYHGYGIRYWDRQKNGHNWHPIIQPGQPYPMTEPLALTLGASVDNQPNIELILGELGTETNKIEVYFDGDRLVTRQLSRENGAIQPLNDREGARTLAQLDPPGHPGSDRIKLLFRVDDQRFLRVTVEDLLVNRVLLNDQIIVQLN